MTVHFPDVSDFQAGLSLNGAAAVIAKATEGTGWTGETYRGFKAQAENLGIPFLAYHFLRAGDVAGQVTHCKSVTGDVPLMLDVETGVDGTDPTWAEALDFIDRHKRVTLIYLPQWFWFGHWHSPDLTPLLDRGVGLISSHYTTYTDDGPGWAPYGGIAPSIWQYTSAHPFNGYNVDFNAFEGSVAQLRELFEKGTRTMNDTTQTKRAGLVADAFVRGSLAVGDPTDPYPDKDGVASLSPGLDLVAGRVAEKLKPQLDRIEAMLATLTAGGGGAGGGGPFTVSLTGGLSGSVSLSGTATPVAPTPPATGQ